MQMDREDVYIYVTEKLNVYSGIIQEYKADNHIKYYQKTIDIRWQGDVHFVFYYSADSRGMYCVERDGQKISASYWTPKWKEENITYMQYLINDIESGRYHKKETLKEAIRSEVERRGLTSYMNKTKWKELLGELWAHPDIEFMYKSLFDEKPPKYYWGIREDEDIEHMNFAVVEWMKINPVVEEVEYIGRLIDPRRTETDFSAEVEAFLKKHSIAYERDEAEGIFVVYGWK